MCHQPYTVIIKRLINLYPSVKIEYSFVGCHTTHLNCRHLFLCIMQNTRRHKPSKKYFSFRYRGSTHTYWGTFIKNNSILALNENLRSINIKHVISRFTLIACVASFFDRLNQSLECFISYIYTKLNIQVLSKMTQCNLKLFARFILNPVNAISFLRIPKYPNWKIYNNERAGSSPE